MNNHNWDNAFPDTPESFKNKVRATLNSLPDQKENCEMENKKSYKKASFRKRTMVALVAAMVVGTTVFAAGKIVSIESHGSNIPNYTTIPTEEKVKKDVGFNPKLIKEFDNGYIFKGGHIISDTGRDSEGNPVAKAKSLGFDYTKGNDEITLYMDEGRMGEESGEAKIVDNYNGIDLYYTSWANKSVPGDYKLTEQDKKDEASGKYVFSYGSPEEKISHNQHLAWVQDGIHYSFLAVDSELSQDELVKMVHQVIDAK
ncbi:hypothetical protein U732_3460 [Clostridium argentinense CDC 2741]|uniref:Uncharacterized protein n=1 Tax=Clostridium argentinense CDC 2741 TaxID=1418104 RepID=A0A0C1U1F2_9CLOT|nr:hypothetical protein [Clostridium argentinense]ARC86360.1 signal peptide protein [Clostridium argentinense]KIE46754.1 hypothetical protein U732_3460 [Clostridium argentinense CDC 2741]NFF41390.1 signal peptide protein [Clostridium argentinense]NFP52489.1 signal peptide protein [Clostridium argentinense]NFP71210.1 signal peptide protein [Clostridium argentinense]